MALTNQKNLELSKSEVSNLSFNGVLKANEVDKSMSLITIDEVISLPPSKLEVSETSDLEESKSYPLNDKMIKLGVDIFSGMDDYLLVGSLSHTLHFVTLLGLASVPTVRRTPVGGVACSTTIGVTLISDNSISVPVIDVRKNKDTGILQEDITYRKVSKGKPFNLNMYELMFLMIKKEYAGFIEYNGDAHGVYFSPKMSNYIKGKAKLPTPTLSFKTGCGSIKESMVDIDVKTENGWVIKKEYQKEFGSLLTPKEIKKKDKEKENKVFANQTAVALALGKILEDQLGLEVV